MTLPNNFYEKCVHIYNVPDKLGKWNDLKCSLDEVNKFAAPVVLCQKKHLKGGYPKQVNLPFSLDRTSIGIHKVH